MIEKIAIEHASEAIGPYSQGILLENLVITSGQIPLNPKKGALVKIEAVAAR